MTWCVFQVTARISIKRPATEDQSRRKKASPFYDRASLLPQLQHAMFYNTLFYYLVLWCSDTLICPSLIPSCWMKKLILPSEWSGEAEITTLQKSAQTKWGVDTRTNTYLWSRETRRIWRANHCNVILASGETWRGKTGNMDHLGILKRRPGRHEWETRKTKPLPPFW
jgi:hypothetical protein